MRFCRVVTLMVAAVGLSSAPLFAHDLWIEPTTFFADLGRVIGVKLRVGDHFRGDPLPRSEELIDQFVVADSAGRRQVVGRDGSDPAGLFRVTAPGLLVVGYRSKPSPVVMPAEKFTQYLKEEGLDSIVDLRERLNQSGAAAREAFSRCVKSLLISGETSETQNDRALGFTLELVAEQNPYLIGPGGQLPVRLTYEGKALPGALVVAINQRDPWKKLTARSDNEGRVRFQLPMTGVWMVKAVHMVPGAAGSNFEWASFWASLTFEVRES